MNYKFFHFQSIEKILYYLTVALFLLPIWISPIFLTGDGPTHLYNSKVLLDYFLGRHIDFYNAFYLLNTNPEPNLFGHYVLAGLQLLIKPILAEKILLSSYVILFISGLRYLIKSIKPENGFLIFLGFPFIYTMVFQMGFFNYSFSIALYLFFAAYWLRSYNHLTVQKIIKAALFLVLIFFTHPTGLLFSMLTAACISGTYFIKSILDWKVNLKASLKWTAIELTKALIAFLPAIILTGIYLNNKGMNIVSSPESTIHLFEGFQKLSSLITLNYNETNEILAFARFFILLLIFTIIQMFAKKTTWKHIPFLLFFVFCLVLFFFQPGSAFGAGILSIRFQFLPYLALLIWAAFAYYPAKLKPVLLVFGVFISISLSVKRIPEHINISRTAIEYLSVGDYIEEGSVVLPISFNHTGCYPENSKIPDHIWLFLHAADYLGTEKNLIMLGNYEASTGYFPLIWRGELNPFWVLPNNRKYDGFESQPPDADILNYNIETGHTIDYVITFCIDNYADHPNTNHILGQLEQEYELIFETENGIAQLYVHKKKNVFNYLPETLIPLSNK